ncbi:hypothetical protein [Nocardia aurantiaca]|uniref:Uncharacterized protein n=1 Tax=Nocardia aurantiaca TaxID=2675850 RepID=A0A6I3KWN7_9NOCA|nr:hypothetical protein [Nocardia aurantiaca]MTE13166.1 hypothetical protein [Nocardia aurantiaca]
MTRDLPFDDAAGTGDNGGDAAYRIANGVARVARAGAYVTGGALIAAGGNRGGTPAINHDSKNVGWSEVEDPQPNVPSPTITFPDLTADSVQPHHGPAAAPVNAPFGPLGDYQHGTDAGMFPSLDAIPSNDPAMSGFHGLGLPDTDTGAAGIPVYGPRPGWGLPLESNDDQQSESAPAQAQPHLPTLDQQQPGFLPGLGGFKLPDAMHLPGMDGSGFHPGAAFNPSAALEPGAHPGAADHTGGAFDGIGATAGQSGPGVFVGTDWAVDAHVGLDGVWFHSNMKVDVGVGTVGHQLDAYSQQLGQGISHIPANTTLPNGGATPTAPGTPASNTSQPANQPGSAIPAGVNALPGQGVSESPSGPMSGSTVPGTTSPVAATGAPLGASGVPGAAAPSNPISLTTIPAAPSAPVAPASVSPVAAPVVPAPTAPVSVAPVAVAQPVAVTPLQTTIQPDAANQPIANLLSTHGGPSPLTAPAAVAPALFDHGRQPVLADGGPSEPGHPATLVDKPVAPTAPSTTAPNVSVPVKTDPVPVLTTVPPIPTTKIPGLDPDLTKGGSTPVTTAPATAPVTSGGDTDLTTKPQKPVDDSGTHGSTPTVTVPTDDPAPTHQPTVSNPPHPTVPTAQPTVPTVPTVPDHGSQPSVSVAPAPTVAPVPTMQQPITTPPHIDPPVKPIADQFDSGNHALPIADDAGLHSLLSVHDSGLLVHDAGLFSGLGADALYADAHSSVQGPGDHMLLL